MWSSISHRVGNIQSHIYYFRLYEAGYNPKVDILYPKVEFPVSTETPILSHLVDWEHSETW